MNINRNNYEEFFLLYADNELSASEKESVEKFLAVNTDLMAEFDMLQHTILSPSEDTHEFSDKESLFRTTDTGSLVNMTNFETYFVGYADDELSNEEKEATENFVYNHPECQADFELIQQAKIKPDLTIQFPDKSLLYRKSAEERKPVIGMWFRMAAAAAVILIAGIIWMQEKTASNSNNQSAVAVKEGPGNKVESDAKNTDASIGKEPVVSAAEQAPISNATVTEPATDNSVIAKKSLASVKTQDANTYEQPKTPISNKGNTQEVYIVKTTEIEQSAITPALALTAKETIQVTTDKLNSTQAPQINTAPSYASNAAKEDYIYVDNSDDNARKKPLRGLFRKAGRVLEQNNPLTGERKKGGVFTASNEQQ